MDFQIVDQLEKRKQADLLILPFWKGKNTPEPAATFGALKNIISLALATGDFKGNEGEILIVYSDKPEKRIALLGLGEKKKCSLEVFRRAYGDLGKLCQKKEVKSLNLVVPVCKNLDESVVVRGVSEGLLLVNYAFERHKLDPDHKQTVLLKKVALIGASKKSLAVAKKYVGIVDGVYLARDLVNGNADDVTPQHLADTARLLAKKFSSVKATVFNKSRIEKEKMGLLLAVSRGSLHDPAFIILEYKGNPKSKDHTVVVGKGVTYDTGGLNLKPTGFMETMKCDMSGAATALGTIMAAANIGLKANVTAVIPATENSIGAKSYKPGDVYTSYAGKTVEIDNTDAEGRLILADALAYTSQQIKPTRIVDFATLTGAIVIALGEETSGVMSNSDKLADQLYKAGQDTHDRVWRLPLYPEYTKQLKSDVADLKNTGGRQAGSITAALFLQEFVGETPWAHCDIAGTAYLSKERHYKPKNATGVGVRLMVDLLENV